MKIKEFIDEFLDWLLTIALILLVFFVIVVMAGFFLVSGWLLTHGENPFQNVCKSHVVVMQQSKSGDDN